MPSIVKVNGDTPDGHLHSGADFSVHTKNSCGIFAAFLARPMDVWSRQRVCKIFVRKYG